MIRMYSFISKIFARLPEGIVKDHMRRMYWKRRLNLLKSYSTIKPGLVFILLNNGLKFVGDRSILGMLYDQCIKNIYTKYFKPKYDSIIIDAGAHQGTFTVLMAASIRDGCIIAIEPYKRNRLFLEKNLKINHLENVKVIPKGLWSSAGRITFYIYSDSASHSAFKQNQRILKSLDIDVDTLDNIVEREKIKRVDFIKMNIEGAEIEALKGARKTLMSNPVELVIDAHHVVGGRPTYQRVIQMLEELGYICKGKSLVYAFPKR